MQSVFGSGFEGFISEGSAACRARAPWQASQATPACLPAPSSSFLSVWQSPQRARPANETGRERLSASAPAR